jgi:DNA repair protein RecO (recombination protein O)
MITTTEAVVLKATKFGDSSKIVRLYTRQYGKLSVIAKGARKPMNRFGSALDPMNHVVAVVYKKEHRDLHLLSQCDLLVSHHRLSDDMERMASALSVIELVDAVTHGEERNDLLFAMITRSLEALTTATSNAMNVFYMFEVRLLELLGYKPGFNECVQCGLSLDESVRRGSDVRLHPGKGGALCPRCSERAGGFETLSAGALQTLQMLQAADGPEFVTCVMLAPSVKNEVARTLRRFLQQHVEGLRRLRAQGVFDAIS